MGINKKEKKEKKFLKSSSSWKSLTISKNSIFLKKGSSGP